MSQTQLIETIIAYSLIPIFTFGLLVAVAIIAHYQLGVLSPSPLSKTERTFSPVSYIITALLFVLVTVGAIVESKRRKG